MRSGFETLSEDLAAFRQQVRLAAVQVEGLGEEDLKAALAYELEPFSGIPASEAEVRYRSLVDPDPAVRVFEVAVSRRKKVRKGWCAGARSVKIALVVGLLVLVVVGIDAIFLGIRRMRLEKEFARRSALQGQLTGQRQRAQALRAEASALRAERAALAAAQERVARCREAYPTLMKTVAELFKQRAVLRTWVAGEREWSVRVTGVVAHAEAASSLLADLTAALAPQGWQVTTGAVTALTAGGAVTFEVDLMWAELGVK